MATLTTLGAKGWILENFDFAEAIYRHSACNHRVVRSRGDDGLVYPPFECPVCKRQTSTNFTTSNTNEITNEGERRND